MLNHCRIAGIMIPMLVGAARARAGTPDIDNVWSRAFTVQNTPAAEPSSIQDARSRTFTVFNVPGLGPSLDIMDARSRIFTVNNDFVPVPLAITDVRSRCFTVRNNLPSPELAITDVRGRAFTVLNALPSPPLAIGDAASRVFSVLNCHACIQSPELCVAQPDCNGNGFNDVCELLLGIGGDCNGTGVLDSCDITACPTCLGDVNGDGRAGGDDIQLFVDLVLGAAVSPCGDVNLSGGPLNFSDVGPFVCRLLTAEPACP